MELRFYNQLYQLERWWGEINAQTLLFAASLPLIIWFLRYPLAKAAMRVVIKAAACFQLNIRTEVQERARPSVANFIFALAVYASILILSLPGAPAEISQNVARVYLIFTVFWLLDAFIQAAIEQTPNLRAGTDLLQETWFLKFVRLLLAALMIIVILKGWGIDLGPALTGLGLAGAAIALAAQDLIRNLIAGLNIAGEQRFREGDWIASDTGVEGIVQKMDLRSSVVMKFDRALVHVPNSDLANAALTNYSNRQERRILWYIQVGYNTPSDKLEAICQSISEYMANNSEFVPSSEANQFARVYAIEESSISVIIDCFVASNTRVKELEARHDLILAVKKVFADHETDFALPARRVVADTPI